MPAVADPRTLAEFELFHDLLPDELVRLNALLHRTTFAPGTTLMTEEQPGEVAYLIIAGTVKVQATEADGTEVVLAIRGRGELVGELSLLDNLARSASVVTLEATTCYWIDRLAFQTALQAMPRLAYNLLGILARRLRLASSQIRALASQDLYGRVARQVLAFAEVYGQPGADGSIVIALQLKQSDLAGLVGASRARVNQVLGYYRERHYLSLDAHGRIVIHDRPAIEQRCS